VSDDAIELKKPFVVWLDYGPEGWKPRGFDTLELAHQDVSRGNTYGQRFAITAGVVWPPNLYV
jgi:hypothetical protein